MSKVIQKDPLFYIQFAQVGLKRKTITKSLGCHEMQARRRLSRHTMRYKLSVTRLNHDINSVYYTYLQLAKKFHPDRNKEDPQAAKRFTEVGEAYEVRLPHPAAG